jgi:HlyD family secretion protein
VSCDGCGEPLAARVSFVAREPQFTPPVIYSLEQREKLVFLVEARLEAPGPIRPGMPVDVRIVQ